MISGKIKLDAAGKKLVKRLAKELGAKEFISVLLKKMNQLSLKTAGNVSKTSLSGQILHRRTGALARSVVGKAELIHGIPAMRIGVLRGPSVKYAGILEHGGTIKPKKAKALSIPQKPVLTGAGVDRFGGPRNFPGNLRFLPFRRGIAIGKLVNENEAKSLQEQGTSVYAAKAYYLLIKEAHIPAKHWLSIPIRAFLPKISIELKTFMKDLLNGTATT